MQYRVIQETYTYTETVVEDENGAEVFRGRNYDDTYYDRESVGYIDEDYAASEYGIEVSA